MSIQRVNKTIHKLNPVITDIDRKIFRFMWKHKITTFEALRVLFYPNIPAHVAYYKLCRLRHGGYLDVQRFNGTRHLVWCLARRGFDLINGNGLPETKTKSFKPQSQYHDFLVTSALLGNWRLTPPVGVTVVSEQELQNTQVLGLPTELQNNSERRPDGLWIFNTGSAKCAVALEVETSGKTNQRYEEICTFYSSQLFFKNVVWIVEDRSLGQQILSCGSRYGNPRKDMHLIIEKDDYLESGWDSKFLNYPVKDITLAEYLNGLAGVKISPVTSPKRVHVESSSSQECVSVKTDIFLNLGINTVKFNTLRNQNSQKK